MEADSELTIAELAERSGVPARIIRLYVTQGLLPSSLSGPSGPLYGAHHLEALETIRLLKDRGLSTEEIARVLGHGQWATQAGPPRSSWSHYDVADDVVVNVREDVSPARTQQVRQALAWLVENLGEALEAVPLLRRWSPAALDSRARVAERFHRAPDALRGAGARNEAVPDADSPSTLAHRRGRATGRHERIWLLGELRAHVHAEAKLAGGVWVVRPGMPPILTKYSKRHDLSSENGSQWFYGIEEAQAREVETKHGWLALLCPDEPGEHRLLILTPSQVRGLMPVCSSDYRGQKKLTLCRVNDRWEVRVPGAETPEFLTDLGGQLDDWGLIRDSKANGRSR